MAVVARTITVAQRNPQEPSFRMGTRLVEVEVVIRDQPVRPPAYSSGWFGIHAGRG